MKVKTRQKMSALALSAIMLIAIVAMIPAAFADEQGVNSVRLYGEGAMSAAFPYTDPEAPFDPLNDQAPLKDFMTFNPALMENRIVVSNVDSKQKVFARQWFVPDYVEPTGKVWLPNPNKYVSEDIVTEYTYMFVDKHYEPTEATARSPTGAFWTKFWLPVADNSDAQIGLDGYDIDGDTYDDMVTLMDVGYSTYPNMDPMKYVAIASKTFQLQVDDELQFLDHKIVIKDVHVLSGSPAAISLIVDIYYTGNAEPEIMEENYVATILPGEYLTAGRHTLNYGNPTFAEPWALQAVAAGTDNAYVRVGRLLHEGETFFVDGAEYDIARIFGSHPDSVKYITIRNPIPEDDDVNLQDLSVIKESVEADNFLPLLPPFNMVHTMVDDINIPEESGVSHDRTYYLGDPSSDMDPGIVWQYDTVGERKIYDTPALNIYFTEMDTETRFHTSLREILKEEDTEEWWQWLHIRTMPDEYKVFVYPELPDIDGGYGDFLLTSSLRAPNSKYMVPNDKMHSTPQRFMMVYDQTEGLPDIYVNEYLDATGAVDYNGLRLYGEDDMSANFPYDDAEAPFDPLHDEAPEKDFVTHNPALVKAGIFVDNVDSKEKVFLRQWFVPEYKEPTGDVWLEDPNIYISEDVVSEYTYMFIDKHYMPTEGTPMSPTGAEWTKFWLPIADNDDSQIGIDGCDVDGDGQDDMVLLKDVGNFSYIDRVGDGRKDISIATTNFQVQVNDELTFLDHMIVVKDVHVISGDPVSISLVVDVYYTGNDDAELIEENYMATILPGDFLSAGRHTLINDDPTFTEPWFLQAVATGEDNAYISVGRLLHTGETFFVDGAEYDIAMIFGSQNDSVKYITIRNPIPEHEDVNLEDLSIIKESVANNETMPMLPPFNRNHTMIDDIGIPEEGWLTNWFHWKTYYAPDYSDVSERMFEDVPPLEIYFTHKAIEPRFHTNLLEILKEPWCDDNGVISTWPSLDPEESWKWLHIRTMPEFYKEFVYPDVPNVADGYGDYLVTSSLVAPNSYYSAPNDGNHTENDGLQRFMFAYEPTDGSGIYMADPIALEPPVDDTPTFDPMVYDANEDGVIDKPEVIAAITDYFGDSITKEDAIAVIMEYFK